MAVDTCRKKDNHTPGHKAVVSVQVYRLQRIINYLSVLDIVCLFFKS